MMRFRRGNPSRSSNFDTLMDSVMGELFPRNSRAKRPGMGGSRQRPRTKRQDFALELMEPRLLLSADLSLTTSTNHDPTAHSDAPAGNCQIVATAANVPAAPSQVVFLETSGALDVDYQGPVIVNDIDVPAFVAPGGLAGQEAGVIGAMTTALSHTDFGVDLVFTNERPQSGEYSTVYIGGTGSEFAQWGQYLGLAEEVDVGNHNPSDAAFVFSASIPTGGLTAIQFGDQLAQIVGHEVGHLLGAQHNYDAADGSPLAPVAFDPKVHVAVANDAADDAVDNGKVTIDGNEYTVHPKIVAALTNWRAYYNGGAVAGDGFPDPLMGQVVIHPIDNGTWVTRVLDMAWQAQSDSSFTAAEQSQILAWTYGFLSHSAGDHFSHSLVNQFAEGVAPGFGAAAASLPGDQRDLGNMLRHLMTEAYIADSLPGVDANKTDRTEFPAGSGDFTDDTTSAIAYAAPTRFIYETFLRAFPDDPTPVAEMKWSKGELKADASTNSFIRTDVGLLLDGFEHDGFKVGQKITVSGFSNAANNGTFFVTDVTKDTLKVNGGSLVNETASGDEKIIAPIAKTQAVAAGQIVADAETNTFTRSDGGNFATDGFFEGMAFQALGMTGNSKTYVVKTVTANTVTVVGGIGDGVSTFSELVDETPTVAGVQLVGLGQRGPALDNIFKLRSAVLEKAAEKGARGGPNELGDLAGTAIDDLINGDPLGDPLKADLLRAYLYNWVDEIDEGVRHWGELGLAFTKAMFDAGSRRELQQIIGNKTGFEDSSDPHTIRSEAEDDVGVLDVLIHELDDPNGDGKTFDSFINQHLLPMVGLPAELGLLRSGLQAFSSVIGEITQPIKDLFNPIEAGVHDIKNYVKNFLTEQFKERFGIDFEIFDQLMVLGNKMDLESITIAGKEIPIFKPGDHEKLDALLGLPDGHHEVGAEPQSSSVPGLSLKFYSDAEGRLNSDAVMNKSTFAAYANSVTLTKMLYLMESPAGDAVPGAGSAAGQLSALYGDILTKLNGSPTTYNFANLNLNGAHGGNVLTATLPGAPGSADGQIWLTSIDADQVWRQDNYTVNNTLFRISEFTGTTPSLAVYEATALAAGDYKVYASWLANVTQKLDNLSNSDFPDQFIAPADNAAYTVYVGGVAQGTFTKNQRLFANDLDDGGIGFELLRDTAFTVGAGQTLRIELSNLTGTGDEHVVAGPMLLVRTSDDAKFRIQNNRDPVTLAAVATPGFTYADDPGVWTDLVYKTGGGNNPLWESATLRPVFRELFTDWLNGTEQFPDLGDTTTTDPNDGVGKVELASHATPFGPVVPDHTLQIPIPAALQTAILNGLDGLVNLADTIEGIAPLQIKIPVINKSLAELVNLKDAIQENVQQPIADFLSLGST